MTTAVLFRFSSGDRLIGTSLSRIRCACVGVQQTLEWNGCHFRKKIAVDILVLHHHHANEGFEAGFPTASGLMIVELHVKMYVVYFFYLHAFAVKKI